MGATGDGFGSPVKTETLAAFRLVLRWRFDQSCEVPEGTKGQDSLFQFHAGKTVDSTSQLHYHQGRTS
jgi:hypothetical protein